MVLSGAFASIGGHFANKYLGGSFGAQAASGIILGGLGSVLVGVTSGWELLRV